MMYLSKPVWQMENVPHSMDFGAYLTPLSLTGSADPQLLHRSVSATGLCTPTAQP